MPPKTRMSKGKAVAESSNASKRPRVERNYQAFTDDQARRRYDIFKDVDFIYKRAVDIQALRNVGVANLINTKGWNRFLINTPHKVFPAIVHEFYANFNATIEDENNEHRFHTYVRGVWVPFIPDVIADYYGIPRGTSELPVIPDWNIVIHDSFNEKPPKTWPSNNRVTPSVLNEKYRLFHLVLCNNILPTSNTTDIYSNKLHLLYAFAQGHDLDFTGMIFHKVREIAKKTAKVRLVCPSLISGLCKPAHVPMLPSEGEKTTASALNLRSLRQSNVHCVKIHKRQHLSEEEEEQDENEEMEAGGSEEEMAGHDPQQLMQPPPRSRRGGVNFGPVLESMQAQMIADREFHEQQYQRLYAEQQTIIEMIRADREEQRREHQEVMDIFARLMQLQPPPPPPEM